VGRSGKSTGRACLATLALVASLAIPAAAQTTEPPAQSPGLEKAESQAQPAGTDSVRVRLDDLGFTTEETTGDAALQRLLDRRSGMLRKHQILGLVTAVPMAATLLTGGGASAEGNSTTKRNLHAALGMTTGALYITTASFAIFAPDPPGLKRSGPSRLHRALAFVHVPAMVLTPILGYEAKRQLDRGEDVHGIAKYHSVAATTAAVTYFAALATITINF
jgi:hypothetical protein